MNLYKTAALRGFRFPSSKGEYTVEDLFLLSLPSLNQVAKRLYKQVKTEAEPDFIGEAKTTEEREAELKLDLVKDVIAHKQEMAERAAKSAATKAQKLRIREIIERKRLEKDEERSIEELETLYNAL